ncbi:MFS family permease [Arthrobacter sp. GAS37]|uniref:MFS transporter n=1 Tax=Arthrobacter sp. GAS37 TaxID=3156261 RepID=UPI003835F699
MTKTADRRTFATAALSFIVVFATGAAPIPLYARYREQNGVTDDAFSLAAVAYFGCAVFALLVLGRLSDHLGRKPVAVLSLMLAVAGCFLFTSVQDAGTLLTGRGLQGLAAGMASSAITAFAVDTAPIYPRWLASTLTGAGAPLGLSVGAMASALLIDAAPAPRVTVFIAAGAVLLTFIGLLLVTRESVAPKPGVLSSLRPRLGVPRATYPLLIPASAAFSGTWAIGGYYQAFGSSVAVEYLHSANAGVAAMVFASYLAPAALGGSLASRVSPVTAQRWGLAGVSIAVVGLVFSVAAGNAATFIVAGLLGGLSQGFAGAGAMRALLSRTLPPERAGLLAVVYATSYVAAAVPGLIAGQLSRTVGLFNITAAYAVVTMVALLVCIASTRGHRHREALRAIRFRELPPNQTGPHPRSIDSEADG